MVCNRRAGSDLEGQEAPDGDLANCNIAVPICPAGSDLEGQEAPDGDLANCNIAVPICPAGSDLEGQEAPALHRTINDTTRNSMSRATRTRR